MTLKQGKYRYMAELRVKEILSQRGLTQKELAQRMGVAEISLSRSLRGKPAMDTLEKIAEALDVSIAELFAPIEKTDILGIIRVKDVYHEVKSIEEIKKLVEDYETGKI